MKAHRSFGLKLPEIVFTILLLFSGISLGLSSGGFIINFNRVGFTIFSTLQAQVHKVVDFTTGTFTAVKEITNLQKENKILTEKLQNYEYLQRANVEIRKENERLREQLGFATDFEYKTIPSQIIGRNPDSLYSGTTVNKGSKDGVKKGMCVIAVQKGTSGIVGKILTVGTFTSIILPVYDFNCNISARIQNTRNIGIVTGTGIEDEHLKMEYVRKRYISDFNIGDIVVTSGENENYIKDIPIGRISEITTLDYDSSLNIKIDPIIDFAKLETVFIVNQNELNNKEVK